MICLDQRGPESAKSFPGQALVRPAAGPEPPSRAARARQEMDDGRWGKGSIFGAFRPATGEAGTPPYAGRTIATWGEFLEHGDAWVPPDAEPVEAMLDNLNMHRATDVLLCSLAHPRWECVFQPSSAASLTLIEPWWKGLRSLALKGRRLETWAQVWQAIEAATAYWNAHRHPFV